MRAAVTATLGVLLAAACGGGPEPVFDPDLEKQFLLDRTANEQAVASRQEFEADLIRIDQAIDRYTTAWMTNELQTGERLQDRLEVFLRQRVAVHFDKLLAAADNRDYPANRTIALAALGFSGRTESLEPLVNGARDDDPGTAIAALLGLSLLRDPRTPLPVLAEIMNDESKDLDVRRNASLAILRCQEKQFDPKVAAPIWRAMLERDIDALDPGIQLHAIRGAGLLRDPSMASLTTKFVSHPSPKIRTAAAIALGRMRNQESAEALLALLGPAEKNDNVRLAARKALQELAGGIDREYDIDAWRRALDRGSSGQ